MRKRSHRGILVAAIHLAVDKPDFIAKDLLQTKEAFLRGGRVERLAFLHERTDPKGAGAVRDRASSLAMSSAMRSIGNARVSTVCRPAGFSRKFETSMSPKYVRTNVRGIGVAVMTSISAAAPFSPRPDADGRQTMLFVDHGKPEVAEDNAFLKQGMGADHNIDAASASTGEGFSARSSRVAAGEERQSEPGGFAERRESLMMLAGENFGRRHQRRLPPGLDDRRHGKQSNNASCRIRHRLAKAAACGSARQDRRRFRPARLSGNQ